MITAYHLFGSLNSLLVFLSLLGVAIQLHKIVQTKRSVTTGYTALLSVNQFCMSYLAYLSFFIYGYSIEPFNHFLVWPRLVGALLIFAIIFYIYQDRQGKVEQYVYHFTMVCLLLALAGLFFAPSIQDNSRVISSALIVLVSAALAQGYIHQIKIIIKNGSTGVLSLRMNLFILLMDCSTLVFALSMGWQQSWPLMVLSCVSGLTKIVIFWLFYWVKRSSLACKRRNEAHNE